MLILKSWSVVTVVQDHWKWHRSIDRIQVPKLLIHRFIFEMI